MSEINAPASVIRTLKPYIGARDFDVSRDFYTALGWTTNFTEGDYAEFELLGGRFYLQRCYQEDWCNNSMMYLQVMDATAWQAHIEKVLGKRKYGVAGTMPPKPDDYAVLVTLMWDSCGVVWHLAQLE